MSPRRSGTRRALHVVGVVALIALVVPFVLFAVPGAVGAERSYIVLSGSMEPAISAGDAVLIDSVDPRTIATGDVITFQETDEGVPTTHRVVGVIDRTEAGPTLAFRTQGDANEDADVAAVRPEQVIGKVVLVLPYVGYVVGFVDSEVGFLALVLGPVLLFVLNEARTWRSRRTGDDPEPAPEPAAAESAEETGFSLTATDLSLSIGVLAVLAAFSGWMALSTIAVEAVVTFAAATTALVLALALRLLLPPASTPASEVGTPDGGRRVVGSLAELTAAARERDRPVVTDDEGSYFVDGGRLYLHREGLVPETPEPAAEDAPRPAVRRIPRPAVRRVTAADGGDTRAER